MKASVTVLRTKLFNETLANKMLHDPLFRKMLRARDNQRAFWEDEIRKAEKRRRKV